MFSTDDMNTGVARRDPVEGRMTTNRAVRLVAEHPLISLGIFALVGIALAAGEIHRVISVASYRTAFEAAVSYSGAISAIREYYSSEVVPRARSAGAVVSHEYRDIAGAIPLPATLTIELGERASGRHDGGEFRLFSRYPFPWRTDGNAHDDLERAMLDSLVDSGDEEFVAVEEVGGLRFLHYAIPVRMAESCIACHNSHAQSPRADWQVGDVRGVQSVRLPMPDLSLPANLSHYGTFVFMFGGLVGGLLLFGLLLRHLQRALNAEHRLLEFAELRNSELGKAKAKAESANISKSEFLANMSHELRTPLNAVIGFAEILKTQMFGPIGEPRYVDYAESIHSSGGHLLNIINDILDVSKLETGTMALEEAWFTVDGPIEDSVSLVEGRAKEARVRLAVEIESDLPPIHADRRLIKQIVINLLINAVKFTPDGGTVTVSAARERRAGLVLSVADTGIGVAEEDLTRVLEPFVQVEKSQERKYEGTGLGLALVKKYTELHGGTVELESTIGRGTTVTIKFPAERVMPPSHREPDSVGEAKIAATGGRL